MLRPFIPAQDFALSRRFYEALGFSALYADDSIVIFEQPGASFILQNYYEKAFAENCMVQWQVPDLESWWASRAIGALADMFPIKPPCAPQPQPWGMTVGYIWDPSGVLWHITQAET